MNLHHLELFYYVARYRGIAAAVRNMPYGIQQPAVSGQIARLEETLGTKLFNRRPFALHPAGVELFAFIKPFFDEFEKVADRIRGSSQQLRIAAPSIVLHDYLPELLQRVRRDFPKFRLHLAEASRTDAERLLAAREVDIAIAVLDRHRRPGMETRVLLELPLILLVSAKSRVKSAAQLWGKDTIDETLISFPRGDVVHAHFQEGLDRLGVEWIPGIEVNSTSLVECYVAGGYGIGVTVASPRFVPRRGVRVLPLPNFPQISIGAAWLTKLSPLAKRFLTELETEAVALKSPRSRARPRSATDKH